MFRKDVQIGLSIGGVLLAVLIVYAIVVSGSHKHQKSVALEKPVPTANGSDAQTGSGDIPPPVHVAEGPHPAEAPAPAAHSSGPEAAASPSTGGSDASPAPSPAPDSVSATTSEKKETNWAALLLADRPEEVAKSQTPPLAADSHDNRLASDGHASTAGAAGEHTAVTDSGANDTSAPIDPAASAHGSSVAPATQPSAGGRSYTVKSGDTFSSISKSVYGNSRYFRQIASANATVNPNRLRPGTVITLPDIKSAGVHDSTSARSDDTASPRRAHRETESAAAPVDVRSQYRVVSGDSLYKISVRLYGSPEEADHLYELNQQTIGADKARLKVGTVLKLPGPPTATASR